MCEGRRRPVGFRGRRSKLDEMENRVKASTPTTPEAIPVFLFQLAGLFHHPPAGDQT